MRAAIAGPGRPLPPALRTELETGFGRDLGQVRVHDGPLAERAASTLQARAFALGPHLVFGAGQYRPETPLGRGLLAHEVAHVLQTRPETPVGPTAPTGPAGPTGTAGLADDHGHEEAADRAVRALAAGRTASVGASPGPPRVRRASANAAPPPALPGPAPASAPGAGAVPKTAPAQPATTAPPALKLPPGLTVVTDEPPGLGTEKLVLTVDHFTLPRDKGAGPWVQRAYDDAANGGAMGRLVFNPIITGNSTQGPESIAAFKEGGEKYKNIWLGAYGFASTSALSAAVTAAAGTNDTVKAALADPAVKDVVTKLGKGLSAAGCDIDHIVEKQIGGTSIPSNLQLLTATTNQASGRETYQALVDIVRQIREPTMRGKQVLELQLRIAKATVPVGQPDPSFVIENLLRTKAVTGSDAVKAKAVGKPVALSAGGQGETAMVGDTGNTPLDSLVKRIVPGMRLETYRRAAGGAKTGQDSVLAALDSRAMKTTGAGSAIDLGAELVTASSPAAAVPAGPEATTDPTAPTPGEARKLTLKKTGAKLDFFYPYLSPGELTKLTMDDQGNLSGEGVIHSSVPFLGNLGVVYSKEELKMVAPIPSAKLVSPLPGAFRFTGGELALQLSPTLQPSGKLTFSVGPAAKPVLLGTLSVTVNGGALVATGELTPSGKLPGITAASGTVVWNSDEGWSGKIKAASSTVPNSTADVELGFRTAANRLAPYATGEIVTSVRNSQLRLGARWDGQTVGYTGSVKVDKPLPLVNSVRLAGRYGDRGLYLAGEADVVWRQFTATMKVEYNRGEDEAEGKFSGAARIAVKTDKADGTLDLAFDEQGRYWGKGSIAYQLTKDLRPTLGVEVTKEQRVRLFGQVTVGDIVLIRKWPSAEGGNVPIVKGIGAKFSFPTPVPGVTAYLQLRGSLSLVYGVGPVVLRAVVFSGELYPFEEDPKVSAKLGGTFAVPAYAGLEGTFGAYIGAEVLLGAVGVKGGIDISPSLRIEGEGGVKIAADYDKDGFSFEAVAYAKGQLVAAAKVLLAAEIYAGWGLFSHRWTYDVASVSARLGPEIRLTLGRIAYAKNGEITWPSLSQITVEPESIDPLAVVRDMLDRGKAVET